MNTEKHNPAAPRQRKNPEPEGKVSSNLEGGHASRDTDTGESGLPGGGPDSSPSRPPELTPSAGGDRENEPANRGCDGSGGTRRPRGLGPLEEGETGCSAGAVRRTPACGVGAAAEGGEVSRLG